MKLTESKLRQIIREELSEAVEEKTASEDILRSLRRFELERDAPTGVTRRNHYPNAVGSDVNPYNEVVRFYAAFKDWGQWKSRGEMTTEYRRMAQNQGEEYASNFDWYKQVKDVFVTDRKSREFFVNFEFDMEDIKDPERRNTQL